MWTRCAKHVTPLYPQKLALTSPTGGGRSVGMVRSLTKATELSLVYRNSTQIKFKFYAASAHVNDINDSAWDQYFIDVVEQAITNPNW